MYTHQPSVETYRLSTFLYSFNHLQHNYKMNTFYYYLLLRKVYLDIIAKFTLYIRFDCFLIWLLVPLFQRHINNILFS